MSGLRKLAAEAGLPVIVEGLGTVFQIWFSERPIRNWRDAQRYADEERFTQWWQEMLLRGVLFHPSQYENLFLSLVHTAAEVDDMLSAAQEAFAVIARRRSVNSAT
jgi:glutamate-1-semialdehyde 2,1-aminomutase